MPLPEDYYHDAITWWAQSGISAAGDPSFAAPVTILGHWREANELFIGGDRTEHVSSAVVHVDRELRIGDYILLGTSAVADPLDAGADRIEGWKHSHAPGQDIHVRKAFLG